MNNELLEALNILEKEKDISKETLLDAIEIIPCTDKAIKSIENVREWKH